jgi:uncharacterized protein (DUF2249 family)
MDLHSLIFESQNEILEGEITLRLKLHRLKTQKIVSQSAKYSCCV